MRDPTGRNASIVTRSGGYAPIRDYAVIGDGRTVALVARDGSVDWLCLPDVDSPSVFGGLVDADRGGFFSLAPADPFTSEHRYLPDTNVLETTFRTADGTVRVTDAMTLSLTGLAPTRELGRRVEGLSGEVRMRWTIEPRFGYAGRTTRMSQRLGVPVATSGRDAIAIRSFDAGEPVRDGGAFRSDFSAAAGTSALLAVTAAHGDPLVFPSRTDTEERLVRTIRYWQGWTEDRAYEGPWRQAVLRSALALKLLIHSPSGAIAAAATTSLPEELGGVRNWDYRYSWVRDSSATLDALLHLGASREAEAFFWWLLHASQLTHPRVHVLYRLNGRSHAPERELDLEGYASSRPVRVGNAAAPQLQLDVYGHLLQTTWLYVTTGGLLSKDTAARIAATADLVSRVWYEADSGIWEVRSRPRHFTQSKMMCWIALDRAIRLAQLGAIPATNVARWRLEADAIRTFVGREAWSETTGAYLRSPDERGTDASLLLPALLGYGGDAEARRLRATVEAVRRELGAGPLLYRYRGEDGLPGEEGAFLACSFWMVDALAQLGDLDEASALMDDLLSLANDVGLYAEEIDPATRDHLGNFPQGLVHLALVNAADTLHKRMRD